MRTMDTMPASAGRRHVAERMSREQARRDLAAWLREIRQRAEYWSERGHAEMIQGSPEQLEWSAREVAFAKAEARGIVRELREVRR